MLNAIAPGRANAINPNKIATAPRATTHPQRDASPTPSPSLDASMIHLPPYPEVSAARRRSILVTPDSASSAHRRHIEDDWFDERTSDLGLRASGPDPIQKPAA